MSISSLHEALGVCCHFMKSSIGDLKIADILLAHYLYIQYVCMSSGFPLQILLGTASSCSEGIDLRRPDLGRFPLLPIYQ